MTVSSHPLYGHVSSLRQAERLGEDEAVCREDGGRGR